MTDEANELAFNLPLARKLVDNPKTQLPAAMQRQAVDFIEVQAREIERLNTILSEMNDTDVIARTMAENERLREALTAVYNEGDFASVRIATLALGAAYD